MSTESIISGDDSILLPGYGLPLDYWTEGASPALVRTFGIEWRAATLLIREICMLRFIENVTNKPEWWIKVNDHRFVEEWRDEAIAMPWAEFHEHADFTEKMADACVIELQKKAEIFKSTGLIPVMDYSSCVIKSDSLVPEDLRDSLKSAVAVLERLQAERPDWVPCSDEAVLDLVDPSLWPLCYGRSRILSNKRIDLQNCLEHCGMGDVIPMPQKPESTLTKLSPYSGYQWLPCNVSLRGEHPRIESYINNLHPVRHSAMYSVIEQLIEKALPAWDIMHRWPEFRMQRLYATSVGVECTVPKVCFGSNTDTCAASNRPLNDDEPGVDGDPSEYLQSESERLDKQWFKETHPLRLPEPRDTMKLNANDVKSSGFFAGASQFQVIVQLFNIHLTPDHPFHGGADKRIASQLNERLCSTALYYYDSDNIIFGHLSFRTTSDAETLKEVLSSQRHDPYALNATYAITEGESKEQRIGSVQTASNRMLFFPNVYQRQPSDFELADKTRPGYCKILALFLVDPAVPIISTANVPPQQRDWWAERTSSAGGETKLPPELMDIVMSNLDFPIDDVEAEKIRAELLNDRELVERVVDHEFTQDSWHF